MTALEKKPRKKDQESFPEQIPWYDHLRKLLEPYEPAATSKEADHLFTTIEIMQALEMHYGIPQGDPKAGGLNGIEVVDTLQELGYRFENTGNLQFHWLMKNKK